MLDKPAERRDNEASREGVGSTNPALTTAAAKDSDDMAPADSSKSPAFQFYPTDFLSDSNVIVMSLAERGAYITLLCHCWTDGSLSSDVARLARLCGVSTAGMRRLWPALEPCFRPDAETPGRLVQPRLERERAKQAEFKRRQTDNGRLGGRPRKAVGSQSQTHLKAVGFSGLTQTEPKKSSPSPSPSPSLSPSSDFSQKHVRARVDGEGTPDEARRASAFLERYSALYEKHRKGARYLSREVLDFAEALNLVRVWDDDRLDKLATVFLTTDHEFAERGSRTVAQFRSMASWCDGKLREAGL